MVVEKYLGIVAKATGLAEFRHVENVVEIGGAIAQELPRHVAPRIALDVFAVLFPDPPHAANIAIEDRRKFRTAEADDVGVATRRAGDRQHLVDGKVGMESAVALLPGQ